MASEWMPRLQLELSPEEFLQLPRNASYRYTYLDGIAFINPRAHYCHAWLDLTSPPPDGASEVAVRRFQEDDWAALPTLFAAAFSLQQPFAGLEREARLQAAQGSLARTHAGGDGIWVPEASFVAESPAGRRLGAVLITLLSEEQLRDWGFAVQPIAPALGAPGRPHLTWIFVGHRVVGRGIGTALLHRAIQALRGLGHAELYTTFLAGNDSSMLWHWRSGFRLLPDTYSRRS